MPMNFRVSSTSFQSLRRCAARAFSCVTDLESTLMKIPFAGQIEAHETMEPEGLI